MVGAVSNPVEAAVEGQHLSHYTIGSRIGEGGMGAVYRAIDSRLNRTVAIKVLPPQASANPDRQRRFVQEAQSASALNHPNIVHIYDIDTVDAVTFIVMEFVDGRLLEAVIAEARLPVAQALEYAGQAAGALAAAHQAGIVDRDVKPANILLTRDGQVKVLDLVSLSWTRWQAAESFAPTQAATPATPVTAAGVVMGTAAYMAPEQADGQSVDVRADVFAFGAVLYRTALRQRAFQGGSQLSIMAAVLHDQPASLLDVCAGIPPRLDAIVTRCLEKDPGKRYPSAVQLRAALDEVRASLSSPPLVAARNNPAARRARTLRVPALAPDEGRLRTARARGGQAARYRGPQSIGEIAGRDGLHCPGRRSLSRQTTARLLAGPLRSHEPSVQGLHRCWRLHPSGLLDAAVHQGRSSDCLGGRHCPVP